MRSESRDDDQHSSSRNNDDDGERGNRRHPRAADKDDGQDDPADDDDRKDGDDKDGDDKDGDDKKGHDKKGDSKTGDDKDDGGKKEKPKSRLPVFILIAFIVLAACGGTAYWLLTRGEQTTDDAYTEGNAISIAPKISGYVVQRDINDNTFVRTGDLLLKIDPRDYLTARDQARASLALARAQLSSAETNLEITRVRAPASLVQAQAQLVQAQATADQARRDFKRQTSVDQRATTQTNVDQARAQLSSNDASVGSAAAQVRVAALVPQTIKSAEDQVHQSEAQVAQAEANLAQAEINLSYTEIRAPQDGYITSRNVEIGTYAQAGQQVFYIVSPDIWITANFKETQLDRMRVGQHVKISIDAYPELKLHGHIDSFQQGSGARFSTFPAENATGNFVKIVRRLPVKIVIDDGLEPGRMLPLGLSVEPTVALQ